MKIVITESKLTEVQKLKTLTCTSVIIFNIE